LEIYKGHVQALTVWEHHDLPKNISARVQQYRALNRIAVGSNSFLFNPPAINMMEVYRVAGRRILMQTSDRPEDLDLNNGPGKAVTGNDVEWLGVYGLYAGTGRPWVSEAVLERTLSTLRGEADASLQGLRELVVLRATMSLAALETILRGCPSLKSLSCTFETEDKSSLSDLGELLRTRGSGLRHLEVMLHGVDMLAFLPHLLICPSLKLRGLIEEETWRKCDVPSSTDSPTRQLVLEPWIWIKEAQLMPLPYLPPAYDWSQRVMEIAPRACKIYLEGNPRSEYQTWNSVVSDCFRSSREPDNRSRTDRPGWTKRDRAAYYL
jgi:hypothetical protein